MNTIYMLITSLLFFIAAIIFAAFIHSTPIPIMVLGAVSAMVLIVFVLGGRK